MWELEAEIQCRDCYCNKIKFKDLPSEDEPGVPHQPSFAALKKSAETCQLCHLLRKALDMIRDEIREEHNGRHPQTASAHLYADVPTPKHNDPSSDKPVEFAKDKDVRPWLFGNWWTCSPSDNRNDADVDDLRLIGLGVRLGQTPENTEGTATGGPRYRGTYLRIRTDDTTDMTSIIPGRLRMAVYSSDLALKRIRRWILTSDLSSPEPLKPYNRPTRVIDVDPDSSSTDVRLIESKGRQARYIALSHRWGGSETLTTTSSTLDRRISGINLNELPKTFQDAIKIARLLHVRYLWIDSLCVIQDDTKDLGNRVFENGGYLQQRLFDYICIIFHRPV
ncbi:HET-domain-containing protein [Penicillium angulare]|uniref:HET-domain-containing protein n=1 Tax=Penicillium angulare TaxID=116970 RepID=A0A9W9ETV8_9EURO|nr:HET-domain-containing protein [Penicillium angulare]